MATQQIIALTVISAFVVGLFVYAYCIGRHAGRTRGRIESEGQHQATIEKLEASLSFLRGDHQNLAAHAKKLRSTNALQEEHRRTLLEVAETLRVAAETWSAFKTGKKLERDARRLRDEALAIADLLKPTKWEAAA